MVGLRLAVGGDAATVGEEEDDDGGEILTVDPNAVIDVFR